MPRDCIDANVPMIGNINKICEWKIIIILKNWFFINKIIESNHL